MRVPALTPIDDALQRLLAQLPVQAAARSETVELRAALGRCLAKDIHASRDVPPHANSAMDGYAVRAAETAVDTAALPVTQRIAAGQVGEFLVPGSCARIFTGAPLPDGADAVVMQENCETVDGNIRVLQPVASGENVRPAGADIKKDSRLFAAGRRLRPQDLGALASLGLTQMQVVKPLRVALMTTGDELQRLGNALQPGQIYDSNFTTLHALLAALNMQVIDCGRVGDTLDSTREALLAAAQLADCVITTGGVSVGEEDHVRAAIEQIGELKLWKLAVKPGKPFAFGSINAADDLAPPCQFFGLPGNPVSAFATFVLLVRPALLAMQGATDLEPRRFAVSAGFERGVSGGRQEYLRACLVESEGRLIAEPLVNQSSGVAASLSRSDGLLIVPPQTQVSRGDSLWFLPFSELGS